MIFAIRRETGFETFKPYLSSLHGTAKESGANCRRNLWFGQARALARTSLGEALHNNSTHPLPQSGRMITHEGGIAC